tara:strand:- start:237 stop:374 length:138 start_codon:yes stop_codon:yes gene_type:complete
MKITIQQFNNKFGQNAFKIAINNGFNKDELLNQTIKTGAGTYKLK